MGSEKKRKEKKTIRMCPSTKVSPPNHQMRAKMERQESIRRFDIALSPLSPHNFAINSRVIQIVPCAALHRRSNYPPIQRDAMQTSPPLRQKNSHTYPPLQQKAQESFRSSSQRSCCIESNENRSKMPKKKSSCIQFQLCFHSIPFPFNESVRSR